MADELRLSAWQEGNNAFHAGASIRSNPYRSRFPALYLAGCGQQGIVRCDQQEAWADGWDNGWTAGKHLQKESNKPARRDYERKQGE